MAGRSSPSDCDWLTVAASILVREGFHAAAAIALDLAKTLAERLAGLAGEGDSSKPADVAGQQGQSAPQDRKVK